MTNEDRTVYTSGGYVVRARRANELWYCYDIYAPNGKRFKTVWSVPGYKRVIRKALGLDKCECGHLVSQHGVIASTGYAWCSSCKTCHKSPSIVKRELLERERRLNAS